MATYIQTSQELVECLASGPRVDVRFPSNVNVFWTEEPPAADMLEQIEAVGARCGRSVHLRRCWSAGSSICPVVK